VGVEQRVRALGHGDLSVGNRLTEPAVVVLAGEIEHPTRNRDRDVVGGELPHERVEPFAGRFACDR
jgi:hypothetical protein